MKMIVTSAVVALSVSAGVLVASSGGIGDAEKVHPTVAVEDSVSIVQEGHEYTPDSSDAIQLVSPSAVETSTVDLSTCKIQKTASIRHALEEVAIDSHEPGGLDADDDVNRDGLDDEYNYIAAYISEEQSEAIRTSIVDGSFMKGSKNVLTAIDIDPAQKITVCDDDIDHDLA